MLAIRLPPSIEDRLDTLAARTGRTKTFYAREAILRYLDELERVYLKDEVRNRLGGSKASKHEDGSEES